MKRRLTVTCIAVAICGAVLLAYGFFFTCWFHDHSYMKASPDVMKYVDSMELRWYLEDGYAGRLFVDKRLAGRLDGHTIDCDISALSNGQNLFQRGQDGVSVSDFGYSKEGDGLPIDVGWSDSGSIRELVESGQSVSLVALVRIENREGEIVYHGFVRSEPIEQAQQAGAGQPATRPESNSEGSYKPQPESKGRSQ